MSKVVLKLDNVTKQYPVGNGVVTAIDDLSLHINEGEFVVIVGRSGCGKSTLISMMGGLESPTTGKITIQGTDLTELSENGRAKVRGSSIAYIFQHFLLLNYLTVWQNISLPTIIDKDNRGKEVIDKLVSESLNAVKLQHKSLNFPAELSGGEKQRVGIARALVGGSEIIIADEPTGDLDQDDSQRIVKMLFSLNQYGDKSIDRRKISTIMVTHDLDLLQEGMRVIVLSDGKIVGDLIYQGNISRIVKLFETDRFLEVNK